MKKDMPQNVEFLMKPSKGTNEEKLAIDILLEEQQRKRERFICYTKQ